MILDIMLPDINGQEVCERVRGDSNLDSHADHLHLRHGRAGEGADLKDSGADDFLHKPFDVETLLERVCSLLDMEAPAA